MIEGRRYRISPQVHGLPRPCGPPCGALDADIRSARREQHMRTLSYEYDVSKLWLGAHYGNLAIHARTDARSNLAGLWYAADDQFYCGRMVLRFLVEGAPLAARSTTFTPAQQLTTYVSDAVEVRKSFFVPYGTDDLACA